MSELYVPYMDPAIGWANRVFIDAGEFYATGHVLKPLRQDIDCPSNAVYFDSLAWEEHGFPVIHPQVACLFESYSGDPAWRHYEDHVISGSGARVLVLRTAAVIGNSPPQAAKTTLLYRRPRLVTISRRAAPASAPQ